MNACNFICLFLHPYSTNKPKTATLVFALVLCCDSASHYYFGIVIVND